MREAELWTRLGALLGDDYSKAWAEMTAITGLESKTVLEALREGIPPKKIWRHVCDFLEVNENQR